MKTLNTWMAVVAAIMIACTSASVMATDFTFTGDGQPEGNWRTAAHWDPVTGPPGRFDTATIPDGKTCIVDQNQEVDSFTINSGGTLKIESYYLNIFYDSVIDGTLTFDKTAAQDPYMVAWNDVVLSASGGQHGTITGTPGERYALLTPRYTEKKFTIGDGITVSGSFLFGDMYLVNNGTIKVDDASDEALLDLIDISGSGEFKVTAGELRVGRVSFDADYAKWKISGGTLEITAQCTNCARFRGKPEISGGTVEVVADLCSQDGFEFSGGTIDVAQGANVIFGAQCFE